MEKVRHYKELEAYKLARASTKEIHTSRSRFLLRKSTHWSIKFAGRAVQWDHKSQRLGDLSVIKTISSAS